MKIWVAGVSAAVVGFGIGMWAPRSGSPPAPSGGAAEGKVIALASKQGHARIDLPAPSAPNFMARMGGLLVSLKTAGKDELLAQLAQVTDDRTILPALADYYRDELLRRLVDLGAAREALALGDARQREVAVKVVMERMAARDPKAAEALMKELPAGIEQDTAGEALLSAFGGTDPARGVELLRKTPSLRLRDFRFFEAWGKKDRPAALAAALGLEKELGANFLHGVVYPWASEDPKAAWQWIEGQPPDIRQEAQEAYVNALVNKDPTSALDMLLAHPDLGAEFADQIGERLVTNRGDTETLLARVPPGEVRNRLVQGISDRLAGNSPHEALDWAQTLLPGEQAAAIRSVFRNLSYEDPIEAMDLASGHLKGKAAETAIGAIADEWARYDVNGAYAAMIQYLHGDALKNGLLEVQAGYSLIGSDLEVRLKLISNLEPGTKKEVLQSMGAQVGMYDPRSVEGKLAGLDAGDRDVFLEGMIRGMGSNVPELPAAYAKLLPPDRQLANARPIALAIAATDSAGAASFLMNLPGDLKSRAPAMRDLVRYWTDEDPAAAIGFVEALPAGEAKDTVASELALQLQGFDPDGATRQWDGVTGEKARADLLSKLVETWKRVDPDRGRTLLLSSAKSDLERQAIAAGLGGQ